jgi:hypothetical protein
MWFDIAPDARITVDRNGAIVLANAQVGRVFSGEAMMLIGLTLEALLPQSLHSVHRIYVAVA